jgi:hypothetical protein
VPTTRIATKVEARNDVSYVVIYSKEQRVGKVPNTGAPYVLECRRELKPMDGDPLNNGVDLGNEAVPEDRRDGQVPVPGLTHLGPSCAAEDDRQHYERCWLSSAFNCSHVTP